MFVRDGYSAVVKAYLHVDGRALRVGSVRAGELRLHDPCEIAPATEATLEVTVDGVVRRSAVIIMKGVTAKDSVVEYV